MIREKVPGPMVIDLDGPNGNVFNLMGIARNLARQLGYPRYTTERILAEMTESDYEDAITVFDNAFGDYVILERTRL